MLLNERMRLEKKCSRWWRVMSLCGSTAIAFTLSVFTLSSMAAAKAEPDEMKQSSSEEKVATNKDIQRDVADPSSPGTSIGHAIERKNDRDSAELHRALTQQANAAALHQRSIPWHQLPDDTPIAYVGAEAILAGDLKGVMAYLLHTNKFYVAKNDRPGAYEQGGQTVLNHMVTQTLIYNDALHSIPHEPLAGIEADIYAGFEDEYVPRLFQSFGAISREELDRKAKEVDLSIQTLKRIFLRNTIASQWKQRVVSIERGEDEATEQYEQRKQKLVDEYMARLRNTTKVWTIFDDAPSDGESTSLPGEQTPGLRPTAPAAINPKYKSNQEDLQVPEGNELVPILGPITSGGPVKAMEPPTDDQVLRALETASDAQGRRKEWHKVDRSKVRIVKEKIADHVDAVQTYPIIGKAQLHHAHYKCTVNVSKGALVGKTKLEADAREVVYVDHNHFHVVADSAANETKSDLHKVTISGTVRDEKRKPVANAHVRLFRHDNKPGAVSRPIGRIKVVQAAGVPGAENQGQVLLAVGGAPAAGALGGGNKDQLIFGTSLGSPESQQLLHETRTDKHGHFQFPELPANERWETQQDYLSVIVQASGKGTAFTNAYIEKEKDGTRKVRPLEVNLQPARTLRGRVTNEEGRAVMGAVVFCGAQHNMPKPVPGIVCTVTDADGRFEINDLSPFDVDELPAYAPGAFATMQSLSMAASVEHPDYAIGAIEFTRLPAEVNCVLQRPASVHGQVLLDGSDQPAKNAVLTVNTMGSNVTSPMATAATDDEGKFAIANLSPGKYTIEAKVPDRLAAVQQVELKSGDQSLEFRLKQGGVIKGRLVDDATGKGPDFTRTGTGSIAVNAVGGDPNRMCQSWIDKDGTFLVAVQPGRNMVMYPHPEWEIVDAERWIQPGVEVAQGQTVEIEMRIKPRDGDWETVFSDAQRVAAAIQGEPLPPPKPRQQRGPDREWRRWFDTLQNWPDDALPKKPMAEETLLQKIDESEGVSVGKESIGGQEQITVISLTCDSANPGELQQVIWLQQGVLSHIAKFPHLKAMELTGGPMPDDWFKPLRDHQHLESLDIIFGKNLTSAGMEHLATLPNLKKFSVVGYKLDDKALQAIGRFPKLEELAFAGVITDAGIGRFRNEQQTHANIRSLSIGALRDSKMTDESLKYLAKLTSLEELSLYNSEEIGIISPGVFTDEGLKHLASLTKLRSLFVGGEKITDAGLVHLYGLKNLKSLKLDGTSVTNKGIDELKKHLPELKVTKSFFGEEEAQAPSPETEAPKFKAESAKDEEGLKGT